MHAGQFLLVVRWGPPQAAHFMTEWVRIGPPCTFSVTLVFRGGVGLCIVMAALQKALGCPNFNSLSIVFGGQKGVRSNCTHLITNTETACINQ
jgi:hypothetical protein